MPKFQSPQDNAADKQVSTERGQTAKFKFAGEKNNKEKIKLDLIIISNDVFCSLYMNKQTLNPKVLFEQVLFSDMFSFTLYVSF